MRTLLLMRGAPGAGKSTWIKEHNLEEYTLCPDELRKLCSSPELQPDGSFVISQERANENMVWSVLFKILAHRMERGEFTVIDATCSKTKDMQQYRDLASQYRYRIFVVDFTKVPLEQCKLQNKMRPEIKWVPEKSIENIYARFATQQIPSAMKVINPDEFDQILEQPIDLSSYKNIVFIGDIHGCYDTLMQYKDFKDGLDPETEYIFTGDFIDRGNQNYEVLQFLDSIKDLPNVCLLEGNHERWLKAYGNGVPSHSREFETKTRIQLIKNNFSDKKARMLYRKCRQFSHFTYKGIEVLACHGGVPNLNTNLLYLPTSKAINGVGSYEDYLIVTDSWMTQTKENQYLVHGHRNVELSPIDIADRVFNLEGRVEFGGALRIVELDENLKWTTIELEDCQPINKDLDTTERTIESVESAITYLRNNRFVQEKQLGNGISSFNFTRDAFFKGNWNRQTILARGLFVDTLNNKIMARSYEKFFRINEVHETELVNLKQRLVFPVSAYVKENGFLAIVSYDYKTDDLFIASKSTNTGDYANYIKDLIEPYKEKLLNKLRQDYAKNNNESTMSYVFEAVDKDNDPHIIKYQENKLVLLEIVYNSLDFKTVDYTTLVEEAKNIGCPVKEKAFELKDWDEFRDLYNKMQDESWKYNNQYIEGFVFKDSDGFMTKCKSGYYNFWKFMRGVSVQVLRSGYFAHTSSLTTAEANMFFGFCKELYKNDYDKETKTYPYKTDIISLREKFINK